MGDPSPAERARELVEMGDYHSLYGAIKQEINQAVLAERERCAEIVESNRLHATIDSTSSLVNKLLTSAAAAIRKDPAG